MKHARDDYNRFQDPAGLIPADEPVMLFRAQDKHFIAVLEFYRQRVSHEGGDPRILGAVADHIKLAEKWPIRKLPDLP